MLKDLAIVQLVSNVAKKAKEKALETKQKWDEEAKQSLQSDLSSNDIEKSSSDIESTSQKSEQKSSVSKEENDKQKSSKNREKESLDKKISKKESGKDKKSSKKETKSKDEKKEDKKKPKSSTKKSTTKSKKSTKGSTMTKREEKIAKYKEDVKKHYGEVDEEFLTIVVKNLGPSIYKADAESVSCSQKSELETVKKNFLKKKLGLTNSDDELDKAIQEVCEEMKSSRKKYRATFYYALAKKFKKESALS